jgi:integrase
MGRRGRGDGSVYQRKDGSWVAQFQGKYRYGQTEDAAKQKLYKMLTGAEESKPKTITVAKLLDEYITAATPNLKPRTVKRYREAINLHLKPSLGKVKIHALDALAIEGIYSRKLADGVSPSTIQLVNAVLSSSLKRAVRLKLVQHNPCKDVELPRIEREEVEVFDPSEVQAIFAAAKHDPLEALWVLALGTGMREGELIGTHVRDFDRANGTLAIRRTVYNGVPSTPKSKRGKRTIKLPQAAIEALNAHIQNDSGCVWMFPNSVGKPMWRSTFVDLNWKPLLRRAGVDYKHFHTCRHYVASTLLSRGLPITPVARFMGHDERTLLRTYSHLMPDQIEAVAAAMDSAIGIQERSLRAP